VLDAEWEAFDRGMKFQYFQIYNPTLTDYVLIAQDRPFIEHYRRQRDGTWLWRSHASLKAKFEIATIGCSLKLADVYDRIALKEPDEP
jgi:hypothetical protein